MEKTFFILFLCFAFVAQAKIVERVLAVVEGEMVLLSELKTFKKNFSRKELVNENLISLLKLKNNDEDSKILDYLIAKKIILVFGKKDLHVENLNELAEGDMLKLAKQNNISVEKLKSEIISRGIPLKNYKKFIGESSLIRSTLEKYVISQVRPTEEDFVSYLKQNGITSVQSTQTFDLDQIFIPKSHSNAKKLAESITAHNFRNYFIESQKYNVEPLKLGSLQAEDLSSNHRSQVSSLEVGEITEPIEEKSGYRIFYLNNKKNNFRIPNSPKIQALQRKFYESKIADYFDLWFSEIKNNFFIRKNAS